MGTLASGATRPVLVIGGTRGTGRLIVERLVAGGVPVRVLARNAERARAELPSAIEIILADLTKKETLASPMAGARHIICTAGRRSGHPATERQIRAVEFDGVLNALAAAKTAGFAGRFMYMTASSVTGRSFATMALNFYKGNTLKWRARLEDEIRASGVEYTIIRAGVLLNREGGRREVIATQTPLSLSLFHRIARADVADAFVAALEHPRARNATFDIVWGKGPRRASWSDLLAALNPDPDDAGPRSQGVT
ncbi:MAG: NAD(P)H-binding protein [Gemmatimonadaceae bacterium]